MTSPHATDRRAWLAALAALPLSDAARARPAAAPSAGAASRTLVAYFSRTGNTRVVAGLIQRGCNADLFEILPRVPYPDEYLATVAQARQERDKGHVPALRATAPDMALYDTVFLGFPIWGETAPPVIRSFLSAHDLAGKTVIPFITHGGYGVGNSAAVLASHAPKARLRPAFVMACAQERQTMDRVTAWLPTAQPLCKSQGITS